MELEQILTEGIVFRKAPSERPDKNPIKTKAKKKSYVTGTHGSASAKMKADIRRKRAARPSQQKSRKA